jgi:ketosteroid isomerase-like protein
MTIQSTIASYGVALNANDVDTILGLYSADPVFMPQGAPALVGREAVRTGYEHVFNTIKLNVKSWVIGLGSEPVLLAAPV